MKPEMERAAVSARSFEQNMERRWGNVADAASSPRSRTRCWRAANGVLIGSRAININRYRMLGGGGWGRGATHLVPTVYFVAVVGIRWHSTFI